MFGLISANKTNSSPNPESPAWVFGWGGSGVPDNGMMGSQQLLKQVVSIAISGTTGVAPDITMATTYLAAFEYPSTTAW